MYGMNICIIYALCIFKWVLVLHLFCNILYCILNVVILYYLVFKVSVMLIKWYSKIILHLLISA